MEGMEELSAKYFAGEATAEERASLEAWRGASEDNARVFLEYKTCWAATFVQDPPKQEILSEIMSDKNQEERVNIVPLWQQRPFQVAASVIVVIGLLFYFLQPNYEEQPWGEELTTRTTFKLPDGSRITVHKGGSLTMGSFEEQREVSMTGKAYFDIEPDAEKPFVIQTESSQIRVLGTSFVVNSNEKDLVTEVMVEAGQVALGQNEKYFRGQQMEIQLKNGEMGMLAVGERGIKKKKIRDVNYLAWKDEILTFSRSRMDQVATLLEDVYELEVKFENPELSKCYLTAKYHKKSAEEVVQLIAETFNMTYEVNSEQIRFNGEGCR